MKENRFEYRVGRIPVTAYMPKEYSGMLSALIVCHGWNGSRRLWRLPERIKNKLLGRGMAVFSADLYGCGESDGNISDMTYALWAEDVSGVIAFVRSMPYIDTQKVGLFGFSSGSTAAFRCALDHDRPSFIVSVATCVSANIGMSEGGPFEFPEEGEMRRFMGTDIGCAFFEDCVSNAPITRLHEVTAPTLILQGLADNEYRISDAAAAERLLPCAVLRTYPEGTHSLDNCATAAANDVIAWLEAHGFCRRLT